jgi:hypothetical protein
MKTPRPLAIDDMLFERTDQPEVVELEGEDGIRQWNLAQRLQEPPIEFWEATVPMELL